MPLTVKDILEKTFKRSFKGYDEDEVDKFLDQIIDEFKALQAEITTLKDELAEAKEQASKIKTTEETIMKTLVSAQKTSERMIGEATHKAELIISSAESTAKNRAAQTTRELSEAQNRLDELKSCAQGFATSFANMVNAQAAYFEKTYQSYFGRDAAPFGGINTDALEKIDKDLAESMKDMGIRPEPDNEPEDNAIKNLEDEQPDEVRGPAGVGEESAAGGDDMRMAGRQDGYMELHEINKALNDLENAEYAGDDKAVSQADENEPPPAGGSDVFNDYSWLYEAGEAPDATGPVFKDPKEEEEFKSLVDDILD